MLPHSYSSAIWLRQLTQLYEATVGVGLSANVSTVARKILAQLAIAVRTWTSQQGLQSTA